MTTLITAAKETKPNGPLDFSGTLKKFETKKT